jgi:hypothetical protein
LIKPQLLLQWLAVPDKPLKDFRSLQNRKLQSYDADFAFLFPPS